MATKRGRGGRPSKGPRDAMMIRPHAEVGDAIRELAEAEGYTISGYVSALLAREVGRPELAPKPDQSVQQEELSLTG